MSDGPGRGAPGGDVPMAVGAARALAGAPTCFAGSGLPSPAAAARCGHAGDRGLGVRPGVTVGQVRAATGRRLRAAERVGVTPPPSRTELKEPHALKAA